jgi:glycosyltransferase involved in cell wall biosynthesis
MWRAPGSSRRKAVLLITHEHSTGDASLRYRSVHHAESLGLLGVSCDVARYGQPDLLESVADYECVVLHRVPWDAARPLVERAESLGKLVLTDIDDLVFDATDTRDVEAIEGMSAQWRSNWAESFRKTIAACRGGAIASTEPLAERLRGHASAVATLHNVASEEMVHLAERARRLRASSSSDRVGVTLAYFSGSLTHRRDFAEAATGVLRTLETHADVHFAVVGHLDLDDRFAPFASRIEHIPWHPWQTLFELYARTDVCLAPLAPSPFSACKSAVKYVEAALVGVPTVASARPDFTRVIEHERNGLLVDGREGWPEALGRLVGDSDLRRELGERALEDVLRRHTTLARLPQVEELWRAFAPDRPTPDRPLAVDWLIGPQLPAETLAVTLELARGLAARGHLVRLCAERNPYGGSSTGDALGDVDTGSATSVVGDFHELGPVDARIATDALTAYHLRYQESALFRFRLVTRPDEVGFDAPVRHVCLDREIAQRVRDRSGREAHLLDASGDVPQALEDVLADACFVRLGAAQ